MDVVDRKAAPFEEERHHQHAVHRPQAGAQGTGFYSKVPAQRGIAAAHHGHLAAGKGAGRAKVGRHLQVQGPRCLRCEAARVREDIGHRPGLAQLRCHGVCRPVGEDGYVMYRLRAGGIVVQHDHLGAALYAHADRR